MSKIRIRNLRSLLDTHDVDIKPLTVLVGRNSSGKSTFLRFFPLMKQTVETRTHEPILWYSPHYVDFGSFDESLNSASTLETISFEFEYDIPWNTFDFVLPGHGRRTRFSLAERWIPRRAPLAVCRLIMEFDQKDIQKMTFRVEDHVLEVELNGSERARLIINGVLMEEDFVPVRFLRGTETPLLPMALYGSEGDMKFSEECFGLKISGC